MPFRSCDKNQPLFTIDNQRWYKTFKDLFLFLQYNFNSRKQFVIKYSTKTNELLRAFYVWNKNSKINTILFCYDSYIEPNIRATQLTEGENTIRKKSHDGIHL